MWYVLTCNYLPPFSRQVRNVASWAGNLMLHKSHQAFPSDMVTILTAVGATVSVMQQNGSPQPMTVPAFIANNFPNTVIVRFGDSERQSACRKPVTDCFWLIMAAILVGDPLRTASHCNGSVFRHIQGNAYCRFRYTYTHTHTHIHTHIHARTHADTHTHIHTHHCMRIVLLHTISHYPLNEFTGGGSSSECSRSHQRRIQLHSRPRVLGCDQRIAGECPPYSVCVWCCCIFKTARRHSEL